MHPSPIPGAIQRVPDRTIPNNRIPEPKRGQPLDFPEGADRLHLPVFILLLFLHSARQPIDHVHKYFHARTHIIGVHCRIGY